LVLRGNSKSIEPEVESLLLSILIHPVHLTYSNTDVEKRYEHLANFSTKKESQAAKNRFNYLKKFEASELASLCYDAGILHNEVDTFLSSLESPTNPLGIGGDALMNDPM
jgi:uncharacterized protein YcbK (DUF882 family)